jgi:hypothetical protein
MDPEIFRIVEERQKRTMQKFFASHELFVLTFRTKPIRLLGLPSLLKVDDNFRRILDAIERDWHAEVWRNDYFKVALPPQVGFRVAGIQQEFFWYLVLSLRACAEIDTQRSYLRAEVRRRLEEMFEAHQLPCRILCGPADQEDIEWHYEAQEIYARLSEASVRATKRGPASEIKAGTDISCNDSFQAAWGRMSVGEFIDSLRQNSQYICNDIFEFQRYVLQERRDYKYLREEHIPILAFIEQSEIEADAELHLGRETEPWDAQIVRADGEVIVIEVTQALPHEAYRFREAVVANPKPPLEERTRHQRGIDEFPQPIIEAIDRKHEKNYPEARVLLVSVLGEYSDEDDFVIKEWVREIQDGSHRGGFADIYLVEMARGRLFKIF